MSLLTPIAVATPPCAYDAHQQACAASDAAAVGDGLRQQEEVPVVLRRFTPALTTRARAHA